MSARREPRWDPASPEVQANPHPHLARLRDAGPIHRHLEADGNVAWILTRHVDCAALLRDPSWSAAKFPASVLATVAADPQAPFSVVARTALHMMLLKDGADHARLRTLVNKAFTPRVVAELRPRVQAIADELLDAAAGRGEFDAIEDLGMPLPIIVIAELFGVPLERHADLKRWSDAIATFLDGTIRAGGLAGAAGACLEMREYLDGLIAQRRAQPRTDLLSRLIAAREVGDQLSDDELFSTVVLVLGAGHETTTNLIGNGLHALLRHPGELAKLVARPELIGPAIEELLRFEGPVTVTSRRPGAVARELLGERIEPGQEVSLMLAGANRDPAVWTHPDRLDLARGDARHLAFGFGAHFCLGAALARLEAQIALGSAVARFPNMKLADESPEWKPGIVLRGLRELWIRL
ncbi:MAG TPA: cytochrome P450 [Myxococcota bacterium]|nr:cytochrome P450 [Myxococcota bacterium]